MIDPIDTPDADPAVLSDDTEVLQPASAVTDPSTPAAVAGSEPAPSEESEATAWLAEPPPTIALDAGPSAERPAAKSLDELVGDDPEEAPPAEPQSHAIEPAAGEEPTSESPVAEAAAAAPGDKKNWYIIKVQSNREESIREAIERKVKVEGLEQYFGQILIPVEKVSELRGGKRVVRSRKMYPGYIMAHVEFNEQILYLFRETNGVGDFVGASVNRPPTPMPPREVERMLHSQLPASAGAERPADKVEIPFEKGDRIRVRDGTFNGMEGEVKEIIEPKDPKDMYRVRVELTIFGRPVPVEVEVWQVEAA